MDGNRFDEITRRLAHATSRRSLLKALISGGAVAVGGFVSAPPVRANRDCAALCKQLFPPGAGRGQCVSEGAQGQGPCAQTTTTEAPVTTTEAPVTTTEAPVTTTEAPVTTTEAPVTTTEAPVTTTEAT